MEPISGIKAVMVTAVRSQDRLDDGGGGIALDRLTDVDLDGGDLLGGGLVKRLEALFGDRPALIWLLSAARCLTSWVLKADEGADLLLHPVGGLPARQFAMALLAITGEPSGIEVKHDRETLDPPAP